MYIIIIIIIIMIIIIIIITRVGCSRRMSCCEEKSPYFPGLLRCHKETGSLMIRKRQVRAQDLAARFCTRSLLTWGEHWRALILPDCEYMQCTAAAGGGS